MKYTVDLFFVRYRYRYQTLASFLSTFSIKVHLVFWIATRLGCLRILKFGLLTRGLLTQNWKPVNNPRLFNQFFLKEPNLTRIQCYRNLIYRLNSIISLNCEP
jgi:hypothetical protein